MKQTVKILWIAFLLLIGSFSYAQDDTSCDDGFQVLEDITGSLCVPENPERVVALEWTYIEDVLALGIQPVGVADIEGYSNWVDIPVELDEDVVDVGTRQEPNLEIIAGLEPDLIITSQLRSSENYNELVAIAPTLLFNSYPEDGTHFEQMTTTFSTIASAVNREAEGEAVLADMFAYFEDASLVLADAGYADAGFILAQGYTQNESAVFRLFTDNAMGVEIFEQIGLSNDWDDAPQQYGFSTIGVEGFAEIGDTLFFYVAQDDDNNFFYDSALWSTLPFVQNENAYWLGGNAWLFGGPLSAITLVDTTLASLGLEISDEDVLSCDDGFRSVSHFMGNTCVPDDPQRVVVLDTGELDSVLTLGLTLLEL